MNAHRYLLDTSAIFAFMEDEEGAEQVEEILHQGEVLLPFPVLLEVYSITLQEQSQAVADERYAVLRRLPVTEIWPVDEPVLLTAARLKAQYRRICLPQRRGEREESGKSLADSSRPGPKAGRL